MELKSVSRLRKHRLVDSRRSETRWRVRSMSWSRAESSSPLDVERKSWSTRSKEELLENKGESGNKRKERIVDSMWSKWEWVTVLGGRGGWGESSDSCLSLFWFHPSTRRKANSSDEMLLYKRLRSWLSRLERLFIVFTVDFSSFLVVANHNPYDIYIHA